MSNETANALWGHTFLPTEFRLRRNDGIASGLPPITPDRCLVIDGAARFNEIAQTLAIHYGRPDRQSGWVRALEASQWTENAVSAFLDVQRDHRVNDWWLFAWPGSDGRFAWHVVHVSSAHETAATAEAVDLVNRLSDMIRAARSDASTPCTNTVDLARSVNALILDAGADQHGAPIQ